MNISRKKREGHLTFLSTWFKMVDQWWFESYDMKEARRFGARLKELRIQIGLSLRQLAEKVNVSPSYISKIENGVLAPPSEKVILALAEFLNTDKEELMTSGGKLPRHIVQIQRNRAKAEFGVRLRELRNLASMTQRELASRASVNYSYVSKIENGLMPPPSQKLILRLADILNVDKDELMALTRKIPPCNKKEEYSHFLGYFKKLRRLSVSLPSLLNIPKPTKNWVTIATSLTLVAIVIGYLGFAQPAQALTVTFPSVPASGTLGSTYTFTVTINIEDTDLLPLREVDLKIYNANSPSTYVVNCTDLPVPDAADQTNARSYTTSGGTVDVSGTAGGNWIWTTSAVSRYGYGYGYQSGSWGTQTYTTGYGYGYGSGALYIGATSITYTVQWTPPSTWPEGTYKIMVIVYGNGASTAITHPTTASFTLSAAAAAAPGPSALAPPVGDPLVTEVWSSTDLSGQFTEPVTIESRDGNVSIDIDKGTVGLDEDGQPLTEIIVDLVEDPPPPPAGSNLIGVPYDFGPDRATFDPPITMTFSYSPNQLPAGTDAEDLSIAYYDQDRGEWVELAADDITVDPVTNTITARVSHFTQFSIIVHSAPAEFEVSGLVFSATAIGRAEPVTISAMVTNIGDVAGTYQVTLKINGEAVASKSLKLDGGEYRKVSFTTVQGKAGSYKVEIDGLSGTFTVKAVSVGPVVITSTVPSVTAPAMEYPAPTAPVVPAMPAPVPAPMPWSANIIILVVAVIVSIVVWYYGFRTQY